MSNASSYINNSGGFITQTRYSGNDSTYNSTSHHTLNPRTKYIVADCVAGGGGGQGGYNCGSGSYRRYGGIGGGGGASVLGLVYYIRPEDNGKLYFKAGAAGLGSARNLPATIGGDSHLASIVTCKGGGAMTYTYSEFNSWRGSAGAAAYSGSYVYFSFLKALGGIIHFPQTSTGLSPREPSSVEAAAAGGYGGVGSVYRSTGTAGGRAGVTIDNTEPVSAFGVAILGGPSPAYHGNDADAAFTDFPGGGGGATLRGTGGHGLFLGITDVNWAYGKYGSGGGGGSVTETSTDNPAVTTSIGKNGGAGYVWIREFG